MLLHVAPAGQSVDCVATVHVVVHEFTIMIIWQSGKAALGHPAAAPVPPTVVHAERNPPPPLSSPASVPPPELDPELLPLLEPELLPLLEPELLPLLDPELPPTFPELLPPLLDAEVLPLLDPLPPPLEPPGFPELCGMLGLDEQAPRAPMTRTVAERAATKRVFMVGTFQQSTCRFLVEKRERENRNEVSLV